MWCHVIPTHDTKCGVDTIRNDYSYYTPTTTTTNPETIWVSGSSLVLYNICSGILPFSGVNVVRQETVGVEETKPITSTTRSRLSFVPTTTSDLSTASEVKVGSPSPFRRRQGRHHWTIRVPESQRNSKSARRVATPPPALSSILPRTSTPPTTQSTTRTRSLRRRI
eukprot:CAMPEP_0172449258 /NCGR_PEP_ID=MMETSP1065-20121228/8008_1 /TAXON_ID=265537 /ORGANISM="Amphiprora paludosa, Strain CCMP125" /LENGTH=166 /DNA_ID=CAMNT_0013200889 /DNA_START=119 /DNA_END=617 /DNA_ORIENTATION=-